LEGAQAMIEVLTALATVVLGLFAGSLLTEALLLVPYFRSLSFAEFNRSHGAFGPRLFRYYAPLTISATLAPLAAAAATLLDFPRVNVFSWISAGLVLVILGTYVFYFRAANLAFVERRLDETALAKELARWAGVHTFRTALAICAFIASVLAVLRAAGAGLDF
jgi:small-conductance mechanosensitive channel